MGQRRIMRGIGLATLGVIALVALGGGGASALTPGSRVDADHRSDPDTRTGVVNSSVAQSFTVGRTGLLTDITVDVLSWSGPGSVEVVLRDWDGSGDPGALVATTTAAQPGPGQNSWDISFEASPPPVVAGKRYVILFDQSSSSPSWSLDVGLKDPSGDGAMLVSDGAPTPTWTQDPTGQLPYATFVRNAIAPVINVPSPIIVTAPDDGGAHVSYVVTASDDEDSNVVPNCSPASGSIFPVGVTTVTCDATDSANNTTRASFTVTVTFTPAETTTTTSTTTTTTPASAPATTVVAVTTTPIIAGALSVSPSHVPAGGTITVNGTGFAGGELVSITLHSQEVLLATLTADSAGTVSGEAVVPAATADGTHTVVALGLTSGRTQQVAITVDAVELPTTGSADSGVVGTIAAITMLAGGIAVVISRRKLSARTDRSPIE